MIVLITGSNGFIGSQITVDLKRTGHTVITCGRQETIAVDFGKQTSQREWEQLLVNIPNIDVIINCVGVLKTSKKKMWQIHYFSPKSLVDTAIAKGLKKVIQISALGIDQNKLSFAQSKLAFDEYLLSLSLDIAIVRPSLVYASGSYGGTSLFRGLAGLPGFIPLAGKGEQLFQPIYAKDLSRSIISLISSFTGKKILNAVGPEQLSLREILVALRKWLGFGKAKIISMPKKLISVFAKIGDVFQTTFNSTLFLMMSNDNITNKIEMQNFQKAIGFRPKPFQEVLNENASYVQDRWHARLYFMRPLLRFSIASLWIMTGIISLLPSLQRANLELLQQVGAIPPLLFLYVASMIDLFLGLATLFNYRLRLVGSIQIVTILIYMVIISLFLPRLWLNPFGPITKNIPLLISTYIMVALESKR